MTRDAPDVIWYVVILFFFLLPSLRVLYDWILKVQKESRF